MKERIPFSVYAATAILVLYTILTALNGPIRITGFLFMISPLLIIWMVISVLRVKSNVKDLADGEEWGYADKKKEDLSTF